MSPHQVPPMLSASQNFAHRAPGAVRARARWQPYASTSNLTRPTSTQTPYLNTPASSVSSSPPVTRHASICTPSGHARAPVSRPVPSQKTKFVAVLFDQTVKTLVDIWPAQNIPSDFTAPSAGRHTTTTAAIPSHPIPTHTVSEPLLGADFGSQLSKPPFRNSQLLSPVTPSTRASPFTTPSVSPAVSISSTYSRPSVNTNAVAGPSTSTQAALTLKGFVLELLRRSKTPTSTLQTALCYIEAVRGKVPELVRQHQAGYATHVEQDVSVRITTEDDAAIGAVSSSCEPTPRVAAQSADDVIVETVRVADDLNVPGSPWLCDVDETHAEPIASLPRPKPPQAAAPLPPLPPAPSPLLCPRRTFLAAVILANKFMNDKSFSNKAWAKLSGLPAREVTRCERALGAALEWRLWVGKMPAAPVPSSSPHGFGRTRSEADVFGASHLEVVTPRPGMGLRRSTTLPAEAFTDGMGASLGYGGVESVSMWLPAPSSSGDSDMMTASPRGTPNLTYSPASTISSASSGGDLTRTIQMTTFSDADIASSPCAFFGNGEVSGAYPGFAGPTPFGAYQDIAMPCFSKPLPRYLTVGAVDCLQGMPTACAPDAACLQSALPHASMTDAGLMALGKLSDGAAMGVDTVDGVGMYDYWAS